MAVREDTEGFFTDLTPFTGTTTILGDRDATNTLAASIVASNTFPSQSLNSIVTDSIDSTIAVQYSSDLTPNFDTKTTSTLPPETAASYSSNSQTVGTLTASSSDKDSGSSSVIYHGGNGTILVWSLVAISLALPFL